MKCGMENGLVTSKDTVTDHHILVIFELACNEAETRPLHCTISQPCDSPQQNISSKYQEIYNLSFPQICTYIPLLPHLHFSTFNCSKQRHILSDNLHHSLLRLLHMMESSVVLTAIPIFHDSGSTLFTTFEVL